MACFVALGLMSTVFLAAAYPPAPLPPPGNQFGTGIQRTMNLLETSTPQRRNTVKILFYGQSITEQDWSRQVADWLRQKYPNANLVIENRAIGGHSSQLLWRTAESDLYPFQPDLLIFHVYGSHIDYETIISNVKQRTTAEVLLQSDHITRTEELAGPATDPQPNDKEWHEWFNNVFRPDLAKRLDVEILDQRTQWRQYLIENKLAPSALLKDGVHLNDWGCWLMAQLVEQRFVVRPEIPKVRWDRLVKTLSVGNDLQWKRKRLTVPFDGNRVDAILDGGSGGLEVRIDGKRPSEIPELYATTRASAYPNSNWPVLLRATAENPRVAEDWTATITDASEDGKQFRFRVVGSVTGADGEGTSHQRFASKSGRVVIEPEDWNLAYGQAVFKSSIPSPLVVQWKVMPQWVDLLKVPPITNPTIESVVTIAQGLPNGKHTLELVARSAARPKVTAIRVYRPAFKP